jgi:hypothetical protein
MRAADHGFADAIDVVRRRHPEHKLSFLARMRQCKTVPCARTPNDYLELVGSLCVAWCVAYAWSRRPKMDRQFRQDFLRMRDAIRLVLEADEVLDPSVKQSLARTEQVYAALVNDLGQFLNDPGKLLKLAGLGNQSFPRRRDHLTFADLGRKRRGAGPLLFVREVSAAMRAIFGNPYYKVVAQLAGLAFETKALSPETVRTMCKKAGSIQPRKSAN